ncbi:unnamed protein product [Euphydryas editha]|uniref:MD-2-related lipid-recognition domain-containing protein n=1 Tax=Euphydryas editha TaxID=104508 RepID=A0AAU9UA26_EUPED|nr:unnamed protein product [Euphydryas editha]
MDVVYGATGSAYDLETVYIEGCGTRLPCYVTLGHSTVVNVQFFADFESRQLDQDVTININHVDAKAPVTPEPCETVMCPVQTFAMTSFTSVMSVPTNMALNQRGYLQWRVYNENGMQVLCYSVMVQTQTNVQRFLRQFHVDLVYHSEPRIAEFHRQETMNKVLNGTRHSVMQTLLKNGASMFVTQVECFMLWRRKGSAAAEIAKGDRKADAAKTIMDDRAVLVHIKWVLISQYQKL